MKFSKKHILIAAIFVLIVLGLTIYFSIIGSDSQKLLFNISTIALFVLVISLVAVIIMAIRSLKV